MPSTLRSEPKLFKGNPEVLQTTAKRCKKEKKRPSNNQEFLLSGLRTETLPDVYSKEGAAAIEDGGEGAHQGSHDHSNHQTTEA